MRFSSKAIEKLGQARVHAGFLARSYARPALSTEGDSTFHIPVVDFSKFRSSKDPRDKKHSALEIVDAFKKVGFVYLHSHGIEQSTVNDVFTRSRDFFDLSPENKAKLAWDDPRSNRGYVQQGRERVTQLTDPSEIARLRTVAPDAKETMEIGRDWDTVWKNKWPNENEAPGFKKLMIGFFQTCHELHVSVMRSVATGLDLQENFFDRLTDQQYHNLRLLNYPPVPMRNLSEEGQARAGAHSDYGSLTFVFQDEVGGLEVQNPHTGHYHPATPIPNTIVVNVGDLLARWSNDLLRSTLHRVVSPSSRTGSHDGVASGRQSIAFFCNPNSDAEIKTLPTCISPETPSKYQIVKTEQYIVGRLADTYY